MIVFNVYFCFRDNNRVDNLDDLRDLDDLLLRRFECFDFDFFADNFLPPSNKSPPPLPG